MKEIRLSKGINTFDFFFTPTIRLHYTGYSNYLTIEWLKWYIGISWLVGD